MFDAGGNFAPVVIPFRLRVRQRVIVSGEAMILLKPLTRKLRLDLGRAIGAASPLRPHRKKLTHFDNWLWPECTHLQLAPSTIRHQPRIAAAPSE
jgi:hypothetical protein